MTEVGHGTVIRAPGKLTMQVAPTPNNRYSNAQITDYDYRTFEFRWQPPLRMTVQARFETSPPNPLSIAIERGRKDAPLGLVGTAGFGFWNHPFSPDVARHFSRPQAVWFFFASAPSNMQLAKSVPGSGWKAAAIDARRWQFLALLPFAPVGVLLMRIPALYDRLWAIGQRAIGVSERLLDAALLWKTHTYTLDWRADGITFSVDGETIHEADHAPRGKLGFIAWIDNQYAIVTPQGHFGSGMVGVGQSQSLMLESILIEG